MVSINVCCLLTFESLVQQALESPFIKINIIDQSINKYAAEELGSKEETKLLEKELPQTIEEFRADFRKWINDSIENTKPPNNAIKIASLNLMPQPLQLVKPLHSLHHVLMSNYTYMLLLDNNHLQQVYLKDLGLSKKSLQKESLLLNLKEIFNAINKTALNQRKL